MCICLSVAVNVGGVLEVRVCLRTDNCHSHFGKIKIMRCLCVCVSREKKQKLAAVAPMCHPHQILFKIRFSNLEIKRSALDLWYLFIFDISPRSSQTLEKCSNKKCKRHKEKQMLGYSKTVQVCGTTNHTETFPKGQMIFPQFKR